MKKVYLLLIFCCISISGFSATWYSQGATAVTNLANWNSLPGGGGSNPATFATAGDIWVVQSNMGIVGAAAWTVGGTVQINTGSRIQKTAAAGNNVITIGGDLSIAGTGFITTAAGATGNITINLAGNLSLTGTSTILNPGTGNNTINFNGGTTFATPQTITWTSTGASLKTSLTIAAGSFVQLLSNVACPQNATTGITVNGALICGTFVMSSGSTDAFTVNAGASLYTANTAGINGSVTLMSATTFSGAANYIYNSTTAAQVTGTLLPAAMASGGSVTIDNTFGAVTLSQTTTFASGATLNLQTGGFTNTAANLSMAAGSNVNVDNGVLAVTPTTYSGVNLTYNNLGTNTLAITTGNEWPAAFTGNTTVNKTGATITLNSNKANTGPIMLSAGTLDASASNYNISLSGTWTNNSAANAFNARGATVIANGAAAQTLTGTFSTAFNNLTINNSAGVSLGITENVNGTLTLTSGILTIGANNLVLGTASPAVAGALSPANMIVATGTGQVQKLMNANGSYLYPVGDAVGPNYTPISLNFSAGTYAAGAYAGVNVTKAKHPNNANVTNYLNRYWSITTSGITAPTYAVTAATYAAADVIGTEANISTGEYTGALPWIKFGPTNVGTHTLTSTGVSNITSAFTGINTIGPTVTSSVGTAVCAGSPTTLSVVTSTGDPALTYSWAPAAGLSATTGTPVTATPTITTTYTVTVTDGNGFTSTTTTTITVNPIPGPISGTPANVCVGSSVTLSDIAPAGGTWSSSSANATVGASTGVVTGAAAGTATISYIAAGCAATTVATVNTPPASITGAVSSVCTGNTISLTDVTAGGVWTSSAPVTGSVSTTGVVSGLTPGTTTISYTTTGCAPATYIVTVNGYPNPISGPSMVCISSQINLTDITPGGSWGSSASATASVGSATGVVTGNAVGTATISYNVFGCAVNYVITVNPLPNPITGPGSVCIGATVTLSDATGGGTWSSSTPAVGSVGSATGVVMGIASGATYITYTITSTGCYVSSVETVNPNPVAISGATSVCIGYTTTLTDASGVGSWSSANTAIGSVGSGTGIVTGVATGSTTITFTITPSGCYTTQPMTVNPVPAAISGTSLVCQGDSVTLSDGTAGGTWTSGEFWIASVGSSGVVTGIIGGATATISYTIGNGCFATFIDTVVMPPSRIMGDTFICVGFSGFLSDSVAGGLWHSAASGSLVVLPSGYMTAVAGGIVTVSYTIPGCATVTQNVTVNVIPAPITGTSGLCDSIHANLYDTTSGGVWSSANTVTARIDSATGVVTGVSLGTTVISYTLPTGCYVIYPVTVSPLAPPIAGSDTICANGFTWLTDIVGGGTWVSSNPAVAAIDSVNGLMTGIVPGITYIVYTLPTGCSASLLVNAIPPVPPILSANHVCTGSTITLTDAEPGGTWSTSNIYDASIGTSGILTGHFPDTAKVTITYTISAFKGCYVTKAIQVDSLPVPTITRNISTHSVFTSNLYTSYQWYNDRQGLILGATTFSLVLPHYNDSVYVTVTDTNGCTGSSHWFFYDFTGITNVNAASIKVFPNPASSMLYIESPVDVHAVISTIDGKMIMQQANAKELDITSFTSGIYLLSLYDANGQLIKIEKMIKE